MDPSLESRYNQIVIELQVRIHNHAPRPQIYECINEAVELFEEIEQLSLKVDYINRVFIRNTAITYRNTLNGILAPLAISIPIKTSSRVSSNIPQVSNDTDALREVALRAKQLEGEVAEVNINIHNQGDQMRSWKGSLDQSNKSLDNTNTILNQIENRWCILL